MSTLTARDRVWDAALRLAERDGEFQTEDVIDAVDDLTDGQRRTVRRVLNGMTEQGWLAHEAGSTVWRGAGATTATGAATDAESAESDDDDDRDDTTETGAGVQVRADATGRAGATTDRPNETPLPEATRFQGMSVDEALQTLERDEVLPAVIDRISNSGNLIAYPVGCEFDGGEDGLHVEAPDDVVDTLGSVAELNAVRVTVTVKVKYPSQVVVFANIRGVYARVADSSGETIGEALRRLNVLSQVNLGRAVSSLTDGDGRESDSDDIGIDPTDEADARDPDSPAAGRATGSETITKADDREVPITMVNGQEVPLDTINEDTTLLYYLDTETADCYHTTPACSALQGAAGELVPVEKDKNGGLPEEVSDLRSCGC